MHNDVTATLTLRLSLRRNVMTPTPTSTKYYRSLAHSLHGTIMPHPQRVSIGFFSLCPENIMGIPAHVGFFSYLGAPVSSSVPSSVVISS